MTRNKNSLQRKPQKNLYSLLVLFFLTNLVFGQEFSITLSHTDEYCTNNGTITIFVDDGAWIQLASAI